MVIPFFGMKKRQVGISNNNQFKMSTLDSPRSLFKNVVNIYKC